MKKMFKIGNIGIGEEYRPLVIPEIGINHGGSLQVAKQMVDAAHRAGARLIKHQTHICADEMCAEARKVIPGNTNISIYDVMESCSLSEDEELQLKEYVESYGMIYLSTPFSRAAADRLEKFGVHAYKIGSGELNNIPLVEHVAEFGKPMILSTGMNDLNSIHKAVNVVEKHHISYALMHTTNLYPTTPEFVRLGAMQEMMREFSDIPIGLSDHTQNNNACIAAMALGANLIERHFTDHMNRNGPDIICSMDECRLKELLAASEEVHKMIGGTKKPLQEEQVTIDFAFATVTTIKKIKKGEVFSKENIWVKRPGTGEIPAQDYPLVLGKKAACEIDCDILLTKEMIEDFLR